MATYALNRAISPTDNIKQALKIKYFSIRGVQLEDNYVTLGTPSVITPNAGNGNSNTQITITSTPQSFVQGSTTLQYKRLSLEYVKPLSNVVIDITKASNLNSVRTKIHTEWKLYGSEVPITILDWPKPTRSRNVQATVANESLIYIPGVRTLKIKNVDPQLTGLVLYVDCPEYQNTQPEEIITNTVCSGGTVNNTTLKRINKYSFSFTPTTYINTNNNTQVFDGSGNDCSVQFWFYLESNATTCTLLSQWTNSGGSRGLRIRYNDSSKRIEVSASILLVSESVILNTGNNSVTKGVWIHFAYSYVSGTYRLFLNGVQKANSILLLGPISASTSRNTLLGAMYNSSNQVVLESSYFHLDDIAIFKNVTRFNAKFTPKAVFEQLPPAP